MLEGSMWEHAREYQQQQQQQQQQHVVTAREQHMLEGIGSKWERRDPPHAAFCSVHTCSSHR